MEALNGEAIPATRRQVGVCVEERRLECFEKFFGKSRGGCQMF